MEGKGGAIRHVTDLPPPGAFISQPLGPPYSCLHLLTRIKVPVDSRISVDTSRRNDMVAPPRVHKCRIGCRFSITRSCAMIPRPSKDASALFAKPASGWLLGQQVGGACCLKAGEEQLVLVLTHPSHALPGLARLSKASSPLPISSHARHSKTLSLSKNCG